VGTTVNIHSKTFTATARLFGENGKYGQFATIDLDDGSLSVRIFLGTPALCDDLIKAVIEAKSMLLGETSEPVPLPDRGRYDAKSVAEVDEGVQPAEDLYRTATPAEHADTAARIERARTVGGDD
jgi:hypothetical protein